MDVAFRAEFDDSVFDHTGLRDIYGPSPSAYEVDRIVKRARKCQENGVNEAGWFSFVHSHLLLLALENDVWEDAIDAVPWYALTIPTYPFNYITSIISSHPPCSQRANDPPSCYFYLVHAHRNKFKRR